MRPPESGRTGAVDIAEHVLGQQQRIGIHATTVVPETRDQLLNLRLRGEDLCSSDGRPSREGIRGVEHIPQHRVERQSDVSAAALQASVHACVPHQ
jgi:hypothetical protein